MDAFPLSLWSPRMSRLPATRLPRRSIRRWALLAMFALGLPALASAAQLVVNGVPIGKVDLSVQGLEGVKFEKCSWVKVEQNGDVQVECPGYDLKAAQPAAQAETTEAVAGDRITKRYWLVTEQKERGATGYDIDLYVNSKWIKRFKNDDDTVVLELTKHLVPGKNRIIFASTKRAGDSPASVSPNVFYRVVIGEGEIGGGNVLIDNALIDFRRTASESENVTEERELIAR